MKYTTLQQLQDHFQAGAPEKLSPIYLILSKEEYEGRMGVKAAMEALEKGASVEKESHSGEQLTPEKLKVSLNTIPMFADKLLLRISAVDKLSKPCTQVLEEYFLNPNPAVHLLLDAASITRSTRFYKNAEKAGVVLDIPEEKPWEKEKSISGKIQEMARQEGKTLHPQAAQELVRHLGTDQALIRQEMEKLICYSGERNEITAEDVAAVCTSVNVKTGWQLGDAIFQRNPAEALRIARALLNDDMPIFALLRQIRSQFQNKLHIASILAAGGSAADVNQKFPYMKGRILQNNIDMTNRYGLRRLQAGILQVDEAEILAKNSRIEPKLLLEHLIAKITTV